MQFDIDPARRLKLEIAGPGDVRARDAVARQQLTGMPGLVLVGYRP